MDISKTGEDGSTIAAGGWNSAWNGESVRDGEIAQVNTRKLPQRPAISALTVMTGWMMNAGREYGGVLDTSGNHPRQRVWTHNMDTTIDEYDLAVLLNNFLRLVLDLPLELNISGARRE